MKISSMKKIGLCAGLFLSGCSAPLTAETTEDYSKLNINIENDEISYNYPVYLDIPKVGKEQIESWINQQEIIKTTSYQYYDESGYDYTVKYQGIYISFYVNSFDALKINSNFRQQYENGSRYFYQVLFQPSHDCNLTKELIQDVINQIVDNMKDYLFFENVESFYDYSVEVGEHMPKIKIKK